MGNAADGAGWTAIMCAAKAGFTETVTALLAAPGLDVNAGSSEGWTALKLAVLKSHTETVTALLLVATPGLDVNAACAVHTTTRVLGAPRACMPSASRLRPVVSEAHLPPKKRRRS